ncbi:MAG: GNAT family N-acetyltransferase [Flavobacteriales bacterium]|nr:GNAT family N-acetyltransferase [Flavobacteriales bacterium]
MLTSYSIQHWRVANGLNGPGWTGRNAELGYWIAKEHRGKGIMTDAIRQATARAFELLPAIHRVFARPYGRNTASQRVLEKAGFTLEVRLVGTFLKNGRVEDELIYAVRRS